MSVDATPQGHLQGTWPLLLLFVPSPGRPPSPAATSIGPGPPVWLACVVVNSEARGGETKPLLLPNATAPPCTGPVLDRTAMFEAPSLPTICISAITSWRHACSYPDMPAGAACQALPVVGCRGLQTRQIRVCLCGGCLCPVPLSTDSPLSKCVPLCVCRQQRPAALKRSCCQAGLARRTARV